MSPYTVLFKGRLLVIASKGAAVAASHTHLRRDVFRRLNSNRWVPLSRWQNCYLVKELIDSSYQIIAVLGFICNIMENLELTIIIP